MRKGKERKRDGAPTRRGISPRHIRLFPNGALLRNHTHTHIQSECIRPERWQIGNQFTWIPSRSLLMHQKLSASMFRNTSSCKLETLKFSTSSSAKSQKTKENKKQTKKGNKRERQRQEKIEGGTLNRENSTYGRKIHSRKTLLALDAFLHSKLLLNHLKHTQHTHTQRNVIHWTLRKGIYSDSGSQWQKHNLENTMLCARSINE